jgi:hypothetical protein
MGTPPDSLRHVRTAGLVVGIASDAAYYEVKKSVIRSRCSSWQDQFS